MSKERQEPTGAIEKPVENDKVDAELAEAVKMSVENDRAEAAESGPKTTPTESADGVGDVSQTDAGGDEKPHVDDAPSAESDIDDTLTERAVRAGLSLAEIKGISSKAVLEGIVGRLEDGAGKAKKGDGGDGDADGEEGNSAEEEADPLAEIDWDEFDPQIAAALKAMQSQNAAMRKEIASLKRAGEFAQTQSFFEAQYGKLDEGVRKHVDAVTKGKLKQKFEMLEAGYKAIKADVKRADVFQEAARLVLGDKLDAAKAESDAEKLAKRKGLTIAPPTRIAGKPTQKTEEDIDREIASFLEKKYPES